MAAPLVAAMLSTVTLNGAHAGERTDLYAASVVVTGRTNVAERQRGIRECLPLVLTKVSGDRSMAGKAISAGLVEKAADAVERVEYVDRKAGVQISDEQGTRERSFRLTVHFRPQVIDEMVDHLGGSVWHEPRPLVHVDLVIDDGIATYPLSEATQRGYAQRLALTEDAAALGLDIRLDGVEADADPAARSEAAVRLSGRMKMTKEGYWDVDWRFAEKGKSVVFSHRGVTFDVAIGDALNRSAGILAKH